MKRVLVGVVLAATGFWLGSHRLVPLWSVWVLGGLGVGLWLSAEWLERRERNR